MSDYPSSYNLWLKHFNALIVTRDFARLRSEESKIKASMSLAEVQKEYLVCKAWNAGSVFYNNMGQGKLHVWNLPQRLRDYKAYLWTLRYAVVIKDPIKRKQVIKKTYLSLRHDNGVGIVISELGKSSIFQMILFLCIGKRSVLKADELSPYLNKLLLE